jgi:adenylate cyclase
MAAGDEPTTGDEAFWREYLTRGDAMETRARRVLRFLPHGPRCKLCAAPFAGSGSYLMRAIGKRPALKNPAVCSSCFDFMEQHHGGAVIDGSYLSRTSAARRRSRKRVAFFFPLMSGPRYAVAAIDTATALLHATGHDDPGGPWVPLGVGVATGPAWVGAVGDERHTDLTALGDNVNIAARLGAAAHAGEVLMTVETALAAGVNPGLERRSLELKGKSTPTEVVSLLVGPAAMAG